jgi:hypothetical protein
LSNHARLFCHIPDELKSQKRQSQVTRLPLSAKRCHLIRSGNLKGPA